MAAASKLTVAQKISVSAATRPFDAVAVAFNRLQKERRIANGDSAVETNLVHIVATLSDGFNPTTPCR
ncbi:hypothetical protein D3C80_1699180 [compost metagenome]